jgi:hypothetical protein
MLAHPTLRTSARKRSERRHNASKADHIAGFADALRNAIP